MRIAIIGNNDGPARLAATLAGTDHEVVLMGLQKGAGAGAVQVPDEQRLLELLPHCAPDVVVNCFANFRYRTVHHRYRLLNVHLAPLPAYRGRHPLQWALINGEKTFGATVHAITDAIDAGPIYWQESLAIGDGWSAVRLRRELFDLVVGAFADLMTELPGLTPRENADGAASYVTRRYPADSELDSWADRERNYRKVKALRDDAHPAFVTYQGDRLVFSDAKRGDKTFVGAFPGTVVGKSGAEIEVVCGDGLTLWLTCAGDQIPSLNTKLR